MKTLVLAEKPSVGREIARVLGCKQNGNGFISGDKYIVTWALGHLVTLADPEMYDTKYKTWSMETLPMLPEKFKLTVIPETAKQYAVVKNLLHSSEVSELVIATDAGREGELVARWIIEKAGFSKPIKRLWISSQTDKAIKEGFANLKPGYVYDKLCAAAKARAQADWLCGLNVTRALTCRHNAQLSAGRVQTPTLAIITSREQEIKSFKPKDYFNVCADIGTFSVLWKAKDGTSCLWDKQTAEEIAKKVKDKQFTVVSLSTTPKRTPPPMLYDLTELQRDANRLYKMSPKQTLSVMQSLYETHKALTYPRTDSRYLTEDIVPTLYDRVRAASVGSLSTFASEILRSKKSINRTCINSSKVTDHHAIIPTEEKCDINALSNDERRIYLLVVTRFFACFYPDFQYKQIKATLTCEKEEFGIAGREITEEGFKKVSINAVAYADEESEEDAQELHSTLPAMIQGDKFVCTRCYVRQLQTSPPKRHTEATLLSAMENPAKYIKDKSMKEYLGGGLGTPATRADIIEKLYNCFYIEKKDNYIYPTSKGIQLIKIVPPQLKEPLLTAKWEQKLEAIEKGTAKVQDFMEEIKKYSTQLVQTVASSDVKYVHDNMTRTPCPNCGKLMLSVSGKKGKMLVCQNRECGYRENVSIKTNARCPQCHKTMELKGKGDNRIYVCSCGFREKAVRYHEQLKATSSGANKAFVQNFLRNQKKAEPKGQSAMALALQKAMQNKDK